MQFGRIHELLENLGISLVSVTESINTTTPHGRMMVNVLLSFAQYERELIAERTRHKIEAARKKGKWTGGHPPLGYDLIPEGGRIVVNKVEADQVRDIFELYVETPSLVKVSQELNNRGWRKKSWTTRAGEECGGGTWNRANVRRLLTDPLYLGMQKLHDEVFDGEHDASVPEDLFSKVQRLMTENHANRGARGRNKYGFLLRGLLRCESCNAAMTPHPSKNHGRLYRYYTCRSAQKHGHSTCPTKSISADKVEAFVVDQIRRIGADPELQHETFQQAVAQLKAEGRGLRAEAKRLKRDLAKAKKDMARLVDALSRSTGATRDAVSQELEKLQQLVEKLNARMVKIQSLQADLKAQTVDEIDLARTLEEFDPVWDVLLTPEKERVLKLLINRIEYHGVTQDLRIAWRLAGFAELANEVTGG